MNTKLSKCIAIYTGIFALQFLVCGSAYISQMYHLYHFYSEEMVTIIAMRWNYFAQAFGMLCFVLVFFKYPKLYGHRMFYILGLVIESILITVTLSTSDPVVVVVSGLVFNILIGLYSGYTMSLLAAYIPQKGLGLSFGIAYAFGSVGTYLLSLIGGGNFLQTKHVIFIYMILNVVIIILMYVSAGIPISKASHTAKEDLPVKYPFDIKQYFLILLILIVVNAINSMGNNFQFSMIVGGEVNLPLSRAFYAIGLILAGVISLYSRRQLETTTFAFLLYPVIAVIISGNLSVATITLNLSYLFLGFVSVYRSLMTLDIAASNNKLLGFASIGLMVSRSIEATSTWFSHIIVTNKLLAAITFVLLFAILIFIFLGPNQRRYVTTEIRAKNELSPEERLWEFVRKYNITSREKEVLILLVKGLSNGEITQQLYVSENTIKFHVKNILKKTGSINRVELTKLFYTNHKSENV